MNVFDSLSDVPKGSGLAIGIFDGLHCGHLEVIKAAKTSGSHGVLTFNPHPATIVGNRRVPKRFLTTLEHKTALLAEFGLDFLIVLNFDRTRAEQRPRDFATELFQTGVRRVSVGRDWRFGAARGGNVELLQEMGKTNGVEVLGIKQVGFQGERISSSRIREALDQSNFHLVTRLLGRNYSVLGPVIPGEQLGRQLGFPTANVKVSREYLPPEAVYAVQGRWDQGPWIPGVANIGHRPTVKNSGGPLLEVHFLPNSIPDLYGKNLEVAFFKQLRLEKKFPGLVELRAQITEDAKTAGQFFENPANETR